ncbi:cupin domain-containing protein [Amycolatopsis saalfeldensis]|uniref:Cupin domain protein n=1 Tax=Amycolatopsis saalfeldensis TaxID=394193 RepID=A0A1H8VG94_9PSEU|nr:cupin domain-containing protein [Amycolatopsis saalfeldensis]SEP14227.1 Cupin domain protein [Amycolatopsis saalfeldensis]
MTATMPSHGNHIVERTPAHGPSAVVRQDWTAAVTPWQFAGRSEGFDRLELIGAGTGSVHTDLGIGRLEPGGRVPAHVRAGEQALYVLDGEMVVQLEDHAYLLRPGDFAFIPQGAVFACANRSSAEARWLDVSSPVSFQPESGRRDTFFPTGAPDVISRAAPPDLGDPTLRLVGHYEGTDPDHLAEAVKTPARGRESAGMYSALLTYSGISVKMLVDRNRGAHLLTLFMVDYEVGGAAQSHDHPFEEGYFFLAGETDFELGGQVHHFRPGDAALAGVGTTHACYNTEGGRVRWLETQAPVPPQLHSYRWPSDWDRFEADYCGGGERRA